MSTPVLKIQNLYLDFKTSHGLFHILNGVDLEVGKREVVGLVGESGCCKSSLALASMGLLPIHEKRISKESKIIFKVRIF